MRFLGIFAIVLAILATTTPSQAAGNRFFTGNLAYEGPVGNSPTTRPQDNSPMLLGNLVLHNAFEHFNVFFKGQFQSKTSLPFEKENKAAFGLERYIGRGFTAYGYAEERYSVVSVRYVMGLRYDFKSPRF